MKLRPKYRIKVENESRLETIADLSFTRVTFIFSSIVAFVILLIISGAIIMVTPLRTLLPGYMKQSQRSATEENLMRLDSVLAVYQQNQAYFDSYFKAMDVDRIPNDSAGVAMNSRNLSSDSLITASSAESSFVKMMEERERFNISVLAPLAADGIMFSPIADGSIFTNASRNSNKGTVILPPDEPIRAPADGTVLALYYSVAENGYVAIIQHSKGFVSKIAGLGSPVVANGDIITGNQVIALSPKSDSKGHRLVYVSMWHNALPVIPFEYIGNISSAIEKDAPFEAPRGR